jgi:hypothetical protein
VPTVLAAQEDGFIMRHLGRPAEQTPSLGNEIEAAVPAGPEAVLRLWLQGLRAIELVHNQGTCLEPGLCPQPGALPRRRGGLHRL